jgi:rubrerythrin
MPKEYIDREAAFRAILGQPPDAHYPGWYADSIKEIPAADVAPVVHGEWISDGDGYCWCYKCSVCGWEDGYPFNDRHKFCPNCGAKMDGGN